MDPCGSECTGRSAFHLHPSCQCIFFPADSSPVFDFHPLDEGNGEGLSSYVPFLFHHKHNKMDQVNPLTVRVTDC